MPLTVALLIGGEARAGKSTFKRHDPVTGALASEAAEATVADAVAAADAAEAAFPGWSARGPNERRAMLNRAAAALDARAADFAEAMMGEVGATEGWARFNLMLAASMIREAAALTTQIAGEVIPSDKPGCIALGMREPAGVVLGIAPWNAPIILDVRAIAVPLACGNTVILKASELCPRTHGLIVEAFMEAGFGGGIVNLITNAPQTAAEIVGALIDHNRDAAGAFPDLIPVPLWREEGFDGGEAKWRHQLCVIRFGHGKCSSVGGALLDGRRRHERLCNRKILF